MNLTCQEIGTCSIGNVTEPFQGHCARVKKLKISVRRKGWAYNFGHAQYLPIALPLFAPLAGALAFLLILVQIRVLRYAYMQLGVSSGVAFFLRFASLACSYINIPIAELGQETMVREREVTYFGMRYIVPMIVGSPSVILAVNVGGAVIPALLSIYLLSKKVRD